MKINIEFHYINQYSIDEITSLQTSVSPLIRLDAFINENDSIYDYHFYFNKFSQEFFTTSIDKVDYLMKNIINYLINNKYTDIQYKFENAYSDTTRYILKLLPRAFLEII